jgi:hypothetical protein
VTVLSVVADAAPGLGISVPTVLFGATDDTSVLIQSVIKETAQMIAYDTNHDWTALKLLATITGDGATLTWPLPAFYKKMLKVTRLWTSKTPTRPLKHVTDTDEFLALQVQAFVPIWGVWTLIGTRINTLPALALNEVVKYYYLSTQPVLDSGAAPKPTFTADSDTFPIGERLLKLAFVYKWKEARGQDYGEAMEDYQTALATAIGDDKGDVKIIIGRRRVPRSASGAGTFPRALG